MPLRPANARGQFACKLCFGDGHSFDDAISLQRHYLIFHTRLEAPSCPRQDCIWSPHASDLDHHLNRHLLYDAEGLQSASRCDDCRLKIDGTIHFETSMHHLTRFLRHMVPILNDTHMSEEVTQTRTTASLDDAHQQVAIHESNTQHLSLSNSSFKHLSIGTEDRGGTIVVKRQRAGEAKRSYHKVRKHAPSNSTPRLHLKMAIQSHSKRIRVSDLLCTNQHAQQSDTLSGVDTAPLPENAVTGR